MIVNHPNTNVDTDANPAPKKFFLRASRKTPQAETMVTKANKIDNTTGFTLLYLLH